MEDAREKLERRPPGPSPAGCEPEGGGAGETRRARAGRRPKKVRERPLLARAARVGLRLVGHLPPRATYLAGGALGWLYSFAPTRETRAARTNLALCLPELDRAERRRLLRSSFAHTARYFLELGRVWHGAPRGMPGVIREVHGAELVERARAAGRGALVLMPHLGSWEVAGLAIAREHPTTCLYRAPRVAELDEDYRRGRSRHGARLLPAEQSGVRGLLRCLRAGEVAMLLPDQDPGRGAGVFAPFFGQPANTGTLAGKLASRSGAEVFILCAHRRPDARFDVYLKPAPAEVADPDPLVSATAVNLAVERCIRAAPEQYLWSYKRFRFQPAGRPSPYARPAKGEG